MHFIYIYISVVTEKVPYSQMCGTKVGTSYKTGVIADATKILEGQLERIKQEHLDQIADLEARYQTQLEMNELLQASLKSKVQTAVLETQAKANKTLSKKIAEKDAIIRAHEEKMKKITSSVEEVQNVNVTLASKISFIEADSSRKISIDAVFFGGRRLFGI